MTHVWGRMATYPKFGDSQLSHQEERPHGETPHSMWAYVPSPNCPYPWSSGARNLGGEIRGRRSLWPFWAKRPKFTQKRSLKFRISVSQEKGASGFCMDVNRSFASLLQQGLRFKAQ